MSSSTGKLHLLLCHLGTLPYPGHVPLTFPIEVLGPPCKSTGVPACSSNSLERFFPIGLPNAKVKTGTGCPFCMVDPCFAFCYTEGAQALCGVSYWPLHLGNVFSLTIRTYLESDGVLKLNEIWSNLDPDELSPLFQMHPHETLPPREITAVWPWGHVQMCLLS